MKHLSKCLALVLAAALGLGLAACGKDTTGDDWRASGVVTDYGTIARDGERVPVCICLSTENAGFYYDKDEQVWFDGVEFPMALADALTAYRSTSFDDLDGDGQSDVTMIFDHGDGSTTELVWLWYDDRGFEFEPVLSSVTSGTPYFEANNLDMNARVDGGTYVLTNGVCSYHGTGDGYAVGDVYWEVTKTRDETHDGLREIEFDAYCYIPAESVPAFTTEFISVTNSELYDYYTGMWLTASSAYNNTERGDNHYIHTVTWNGETYEIEFFYSTSWEKTGDWSNVLTKSYVGQARPARQHLPRGGHSQLRHGRRAQLPVFPHRLTGSGGRHENISQKAHGAAADPAAGAESGRLRRHGRR